MGLANLFIFIIKNLNRIINCKFIFVKPKKGKYLLFDRERKSFLQNYNLVNKIQILDLRFESINIPVLYETFKTTGLKNLTKNYIKNYILNVRPKIIFTFTDYNPTFYLLKNLVKKKFKTIAIQSSFRPLKTFNAFDKKKYKIYECDYFLFLDEFTKNKILKKIFTTKFLNIGSFKNNSIKTSNKKKYDFLFLSQFKTHFPQDAKEVYDREKKIVK